MRQSEGKPIESITDLLKRIQKHRVPDEIHWFRGQADSAWDLKPSIARKDEWLNFELTLLKKFKQNGISMLHPRPESEWEWIFIMQHYGVPTRLLDWSESPLVALYFSVSGTNEINQDGAFWTLLPRILNKEANIEPDIKTDIPAFGDDSVLDNYLPTSISSEKTSKNKPVAAIAPRTSDRIIAQHGVFTVNHRRSDCLSTVGDGSHVWKYVIPAASKVKILAELDALNINKMSMFPELHNLGNKVREELP